MDTDVFQVDNFLSDIISLESVEACLDSDLTLIEPSLTQMSSTVSATRMHHLDSHHTQKLEWLYSQ